MNSEVNKELTAESTSAEEKAMRCANKKLELINEVIKELDIEIKAYIIWGDYKMHKRSRIRVSGAKRKNFIGMKLVGLDKYMLTEEQKKMLKDLLKANEKTRKMFTDKYGYFNFSVYDTLGSFYSKQ